MIDKEKFGYTAGDITITDSDWSDKEWAALKAMASELPSGPERETWLDACNRREKEYAQVLMVEFGLSFPIIKD